MSTPSHVPVLREGFPYVMASSYTKTGNILMTSSNGSISALLALCAGNSPVTGEFPAQRPVTRSFDVFFDLRLNKRLRKQSRGWWSETPSRSVWRYCNDINNVWSYSSLLGERWQRSWEWADETVTSTYFAHYDHTISHTIYQQSCSVDLSFNEIFPNKSFRIAIFFRVASLALGQS